MSIDPRLFQKSRGSISHSFSLDLLRKSAETALASCFGSQNDKISSYK
jgi:hypothetical protein